MKREKRTLQMILAAGVLILLLLLIRSEFALKLLLFFSGAFILFLLYPYCTLRIQSIRRRFFGPVYGYRNSGNELTGQRLTGMAESLQTLAKTFRSPEYRALEPDKNTLVEAITEKLCKDCSGCETCWGTYAESSYHAICELMEVACEKGRLAAEEFPETFREHCVCTEQYALELNNSLLSVKQEQLMQNRLRESAEIVADQISELATALKACSHMFFEKQEVTELQKQMIAGCLHAEQILTREIVLFTDRGDGRELRIVARCKRGNCVTVKAVAELLGSLLEIPLLSVESNRNVIGTEYAEYVFIEQPRYYVLTGCAQMIREDGTSSGDNYSFLKAGQKDAVMILADGMGSGTEAGKDSSMVVELLEQMLDSGFAEQSVVRMVNAALMLKQEQVKFTTLDLSVLNLYTGNCEFIKAGACTTFLKRKTFVEAITSTSVPLGFVKRPELETKHKKLYHGDYIVMLSDGALDCLGVQNREEYLENMIAELTEKSPQEIANSLLAGIRQGPGYSARDDITILVTGIYNNA